MEHDIAIFALGSFKQCIIDKAYLYNDIDIPVIVTGAPEIDLEELPGVDAYVPGLGRIPRRLKRGENIRALKKLVETVEDLLKLDYDKYHEEIENVIIGDQKLKDIAEIKKSHFYDYILVELLTESSLVD